MMKTRVVQGFQWIDGARFVDEDGMPDETNEECAAGCGDRVLTGQDYWVCAENTEHCHRGCRIPVWS